MRVRGDERGSADVRVLYGSQLSHHLLCSGTKYLSCIKIAKSATGGEDRWKCPSQREHGCFLLCWSRSGVQGENSLCFPRALLSSAAECLRSL